MRGPLLVVSADPEVTEEVRFSIPSETEIVTAIDARDAIGALERTTPSVVIVDLMTGRAGGFALAKDLCQSPRLDGVPVIMLVERDHDRWLAGQAGAAAVLRKPVEGGALLAALSSVLGQSVTPT